jgi:hypothetical protein
VNDWLAPALTEAERVKRASDELDNEADQEAGSSAPRKFHPGEKAFHLLRLLKEHYLFLCFLHEFGKHYRQLVKFYQHTSVPIAHLLYYEILIFQQHLFNLCLRFKEDEIEEQMGEAEAPAAGEARPKRISNAPRKHDLEKVDRKLYCTCQKMYDYDNEDNNDTMIECGSGDMCTNEIKWFHIGCVGFLKKNLNKLEYLCASCIKRRNRGPNLPPGETRTVRPPLAPWRAFANDVKLPSAQDLKGQFWSQLFRTRIRENARLEVRPLDSVSWAEYPSVSKCIQSHPNVKEENVRALMQFVLRFVCSLNTRLSHKNDMLTPEALTLFDPRAKAKERNAAMRSEYLNHLLTRSGVAENASRDIRSGCVVWYTNPPAFNEIDTPVSACALII